VKLILTGATGFVGKQILASLGDYDVTVIGRNRPETLHNISFYHAEIDGSSDYSEGLVNGDVMIHCAARAHIMKDTAIDPLETFREVNTRGTINLAKQAAKAGIKRFIFISSIKVNGGKTSLKQPFSPEDVTNPEDDYGVSKAEAESSLLELSKNSRMEVVIIRPPLVYGPGVKANFAAMLSLVNKGIPLPFGALTENKRSLVSVYNLVDLVVNCISNPNAANQTFLVSDDNDLSTADMVKELSVALGKSGRLIPIPVQLYKFIGKITGKSAIVERLCGSLQTDISKTKRLLDWRPPFTVKEAFAKTAEYYTNNIGN
jgi:UDP-glucose 4-epimerase